MREGEDRTMSRLHSFITFVWFVIYSVGMPLADDDDDNDGDDDGCWSDSESPQPVQHMVVSTTPVHVLDSPSGVVRAPYEHPPTPHPSPSQHPHATLPVSHRSQTPAIVGTAFGILIALVAFFFTTRYVIRRRRFATDPFRDPPKPRFTVFRFRPRSTGSKKRLSDESWVSPILPVLGSPESPLSQDLELSRYTIPRRKLVPVTTPVCTPTDTEFGSRLEFDNGDPNSILGSVVVVPPVRMPSPVYISPFSPSPSLSSESSSLSPTPSTEPLTLPSLDPARLSRLLSSTFGVTRAAESPTRPTTAHLIHTARSYAHAYRPSSATTTSLYTPPTPSARVSGTRSRTSFYPGRTVRDTFSTVTTADTDMVPHLLRAVAEDQPSSSPFVDPDPRSGNVDPVTPSASASSMEQSKGTEGEPLGTLLGLKLRLSDASEHARYRLREKERERERQEERGGGGQRLSTESTDEPVGRKEFKLRDSETVLREIGW